jgi:hypothetical protein
MEEVPRSCWDASSPRNRWHDYMTFYYAHGNIVRALGGHHLVIGLDTQNPVHGLCLYAITYAMRAHPYGCSHRRAFRGQLLPICDALVGAAVGH